MRAIRPLPSIRGELHNDGHLRVAKVGNELVIDAIGKGFASGVVIPIREAVRGR